MQRQSQSSLGPTRAAILKLAVALLSLTLLGCSGGVDDELRAYIKEIASKTAKPEPPPPRPTPYLVYNYTVTDGEGADRVDPFQSFLKEPERDPLTPDPAKDDPLAPLAGRIKEELEGHPLDSLRMVGTLEQDTDVWGVIAGRDGTVYRVQVGNYIGQNYGKIIAILEDRVEVEERAKDTVGKWQVRNASLALAE